MTADDLKPLRMPIGLWVVITCLMGGAVYYTDMLAKKSSVELERKKTELRTAQSRMQQSGSEKDIIVQYVGKYRELQKTGFAGEEQRINWLDALRAANAGTDLFGVNYQINAQKPYAYAQQFDTGTVKLMESVMELDLNLLHEGDLLRFFEALRAQRVGLFHINSCELRQINPSPALRNQANVSADCKISWLTALPGQSALPAGARR